MRYNTHQQALLKQAFDLVARALAESPAISSHKSATSIVVPEKPRTATVLTSAQSDDGAVVSGAQMSAQSSIGNAHAIKASVLCNTVAGHFFAKLPYEGLSEQQQNTSVIDSTRKAVQSQSTATQPVTAAQHYFGSLPWDLSQATQDSITLPPTVIKQSTAGEWFSQIDWQGSTRATLDTDAQSFARMATSTALNTASRAVGRSQL